MRVRAAFLVTVEAEVEDYGKFVAPHDPAPSVEQAQSWLSQNYFDRIDSGVEVGDRPESLTWSVDTVVNIDEVADLVAHDWALADHIYGDDGFRDFVSEQERDGFHDDNSWFSETVLRRYVEATQDNAEQERVDQLVEDWSKGEYARDGARGYRDFL